MQIRLFVPIILRKGGVGKSANGHWLFGYKMSCAAWAAEHNGKQSAIKKMLSAKSMTEKTF